MPPSITTTTGRAALEPRREPYFRQIEAGRFLGYRKLDKERGSWVARARDTASGKQHYCALKLPAGTTYSGALKEANKWFKELDAGVVRTGPFTLAMAADEYLAELRRNGRERAAVYSEWQFRRTGILDGAIGATDLTRLRLPHLKAWRDEIAQGAGQGTVNRLVTPVKAAVALAVENSRVPSTALDSWRKLKSYRGVDGHRDNYLTLEQRRALLAAAAGPIRDLIEAALTTGARVGELVSAKRGAFDARTRTLKLSGKTRARAVPLSPAAMTLFERLSKSKLPGALLLTNGGKPWTRIEWSRAMRSAVEDAGLPTGTVMYDCRHTFISQALHDGLNVLDVSKVCGTSIVMIQQNYGHIRADAVRERLAQVTML